MYYIYALFLFSTFRRWVLIMNTAQTRYGSANHALIYLREIGKQDKQSVDILQFFTVGCKKDAFKLSSKLLNAYNFAN